MALRSVDVVDESGLTSLLAEMADRHSVPGGVLGILREKQVTVVHTGVADVASGEPITPGTRFGVGSITKPITATVILRLAAEGYLTIDDPLAEHVPELRESEWARTATIRDLLANRSRIPLRTAWEFDLEGDDRDVLARCVAQIGTDRPTGAFWSYSNLGWVVLGRLIENLTGLAWEDAIQRHVLDPFAMDQTTFALAPVAESRATGHEVTPNGPQPVPFWSARSYCSAGTSVLSTATDLLRFAATHLDDPYLATMRETHADISIHGWLDGWCLGWARFDWDGEPVWGWDGVLPGQRMVLRILPAHKTAVILATNGSTGRAMCRSLLQPLMEELGITVPALRLQPKPGASVDLARFAGEYMWPDRRCRVTATDDSLAIEVDDRRVTAAPTGDGIFLIDPDNPDNPTVTFGGFDTAGQPQIIYVMLWGMPRA
ncbi:MAG TPA: serine hydrolase domain-containing protein [Acidimicrobiia bacterium]